MKTMHVFLLPESPPGFMIKDIDVRELTYSVRGGAILAHRCIRPGALEPGASTCTTTTADASGSEWRPSFISTALHIYTSHTSPFYYKAFSENGSYPERGLRSNIESMESYSAHITVLVVPYQQYRWRFTVELSIPPYTRAASQVDSGSSRALELLRGAAAGLSLLRRLVLEDNSQDVLHIAR